MYRLQVIAEAERELDHEVGYSIAHWGQTHGQKYGRELRKQIRSLKSNPRLYPVRNDTLPGIRIKIYKGNRIVYTLREDRKLVVVLALMSIYQNIDSAELNRRQSEI